MKNEGILDRSIRFLLAIVFFVVGSLFVDGWSRIVLYVLSLGMIITVTTGICFAYKLLDIDTRGDKK